MVVAGLRVNIKSREAKSQSMVVTGHPLLWEAKEPVRLTAQPLELLPQQIQAQVVVVVESIALRQTQSLVVVDQLAHTLMRLSPTQIPHTAIQLEQQGLQARLEQVAPQVVRAARALLLFMNIINRSPHEISLN
jgi:hypothetical protein